MAMSQENVMSLIWEKDGFNPIIIMPNNVSA